MDIDSSEVSFVIECNDEPIAEIPSAPEDPAKARKKLLEKCVGTPKAANECKSFKQMCDFASGPLHTLPHVKTHLGGVYWLEFPDQETKESFLKSGILDPLTVVPKSNPMAVGGPPKNLFLL